MQYLVQSITVSQYKELALSFYLQSRRVDSGHWFEIQYSVNESDLWSQVERFDLGTAPWLGNNNWYLAVVPGINVASATSVRFRFRAHFSTNRNKLYLDEMILNGLWI